MGPGAALQPKGILPPLGSRLPCRHAAEQEGQGTWYCGGPQVWEQYQALQPPEEEEAPTW